MHTNLYFLLNSESSQSLTVNISYGFFRISHITAIGFNPASLHKSTLASVCPSRSNTPPSLATSPKQ